jgi:drug/metabolite transporter (DMT)-like permease
MVFKENMANRKYILLIALGVLMLVIGYVCLGTGPATNPLSITVAPIILVLAYLVVIPLGILWGGKQQGQQKGD